MNQREYDALTEEEKLDGTIRFIDDFINVQESSLTIKKLLFEDLLYRYAYVRNKAAEYDFSIAHKSNSKYEKHSFMLGADVDIRNFAGLLRQGLGVDE